jgi:hypothetical protein
MFSQGGSTADQKDKTQPDDNGFPAMYELSVRRSRLAPLRAALGGANAPPQATPYGSNNRIHGTWRVFGLRHMPCGHPGTLRAHVAPFCLSKKDISPGDSATYGNASAHCIKTQRFLLGYVPQKGTKTGGLGLTQDLLHTSKHAQMA